MLNLSAAITVVLTSSFALAPGDAPAPVGARCQTSPERPAPQGTCDADSQCAVTERELGICIPQLDAIATLAAGRDHVCVALTSGEVYCWGDQTYGQLGAGGSSVGEAVAIGGDVVELVAGERHTCARLEDGAVRCWGDNALGQLGLASTELIGDDERPVDVDPVALGGAAVSLSAAGRHTCAVLDAGELRCWGDNSLGQLGTGDRATVGDDEQPAAIPTGSAVLEVIADPDHSCVELADGTNPCVGMTWNGKLVYSG